jgi:hypothetical protein
MPFRCGCEGRGEGGLLSALQLSTVHAAVPALRRCRHWHCILLMPSSPQDLSRVQANVYCVKCKTMILLSAGLQAHQLQQLWAVVDAAHAGHPLPGFPFR